MGNLLLTVWNISTFTSHSPCSIHEDTETTFYCPTFQPSRQTTVLEKLAHGTRSAIRQLSDFNSKAIRTCCLH